MTRRLVTPIKKTSSVGVGLPIMRLPTADAQAQQARGLAQRCALIKGRPATKEELQSVHSADYVQRICSLRNQASRGTKEIFGVGS